MKSIFLSSLLVASSTVWAASVPLVLQLDDDQGSPIEGAATVQVLTSDGAVDLSCEQFSVTFIAGVANVVVGDPAGATCDGSALITDLDQVMPRAVMYEVAVTETNGGVLTEFAIPVPDDGTRDVRKFFLKGGSTRVEIDKVIEQIGLLGASANEPVLVELGAGAHDWRGVQEVFFPAHVSVKGQGPMATRIDGRIQVSGRASVQDLGIDADDQAGRIISMIALDLAMSVKNVDIVGTTNVSSGPFRSGIGISGDASGLLSQITISDVTINLQTSNTAQNGIFVELDMNGGVPLLKIDDVSIRSITGNTNEAIVINSGTTPIAAALIVLSDVVVLGDTNPALRQNSGIRVSVNNLQQSIFGVTGFGGNGTGVVTVQSSQLFGRFGGATVTVNCVASVAPDGTGVDCTTP